MGTKMSEDNSIKLNNEQLNVVTGGDKDDDGGKSRNAVICPQCSAKNYPAHTVIRDTRRFTCWRCGYSRELTDGEVQRILSGQGMSW